MALSALKRVREGLKFFRLNPTDARLDRVTADNERIRRYQLYARYYEGYLARGLITTGDPTHTKRLKYNFCRPIIAIPAGFLAGVPLIWEVRNDDGTINETATETAKKVWDRSGAERAFLEAAISTNIYGDCLLKVQRERLPDQPDKEDPDSLPTIEFLCPDLCFPLFGGHNHDQLIALEIAYVVTEGENQYTRHEYYDLDGAEVYHDESLVDRFTYPAIPAVWVRNNRSPNEIYGKSDLDGVMDLIDEYDHVARKQTAIIDYYANPRIVAEGVRQSDLTLDVNTFIFAPLGSKLYFLEWSGSGPAVMDQLTTIRNAIAEVSQIPAIAFGQMDAGHSTISGIGMKILYGPLLNKVQRKQANWGPALERAMWLALMAMGQTVPLPAVNVIWPDPTPVDPKALIEQETMAVTGGIKSKTSAMRAIGIEDPEAEIELIKEEQETLIAPEVKAAMELQARESEEGEEEEEEAPPRRVN